jgi:hypothetical protein
MGAYARLEAERSGLYAEVADALVDIEQFQSLDDKPKRLVARHIVERMASMGNGDAAGVDAANAGSDA